MPLAGRTIVVTRSRAQARKLADGLAALGAEVLAWPVIRIIEPSDWEPADAAIQRLASYDVVVFTSANAVDRFVARVMSRKLPLHRLRSVPIAVVGKATAARLRRHALTPAIVPDEFVAEGLLDKLESRGIGSGSRVLIPRALEAREILPETLRERGAVVDVVPVYQTVRGQVEPEIVSRITAGDIDAVTFTSGSTVENFLALLAEGLPQDVSVAEALDGVALASIGPVTSATIESHELPVAVQPDTYTVPALIDALSEHFASPDADVG